MDREWTPRRAWRRWTVAILSLPVMVLIVWGIVTLEEYRSQRLLEESVILGESLSGETVSAVFLDPVVTAAQWDFADRYRTIRQFYLKDKELLEVGLERLASFPDLQILVLTGSHGIRDEHLIPLRNLPCLRSLSLDGTDVADANIHLLRDIASLESVTLAGCLGITDQSVSPIINLERLKRINLQGTSVSLDGFERLRRARPELMIHVVAGDFLTGAWASSEPWDGGGGISATLSSPQDVDTLLQMLTLPHDWDLGHWTPDPTEVWTSLQIDGRYAGEMLPHLSTSLPSLESLTLSDTACGPHFESVPSTLKDLSLYQVDLGSTLASIGRITSLEQLTMSSVSSPEPVDFRFLKQLPHLVSFYLADSDEFDLAILADVETLEVLSFSKVRLTDEAVVPSLKFPQLESLNLDRCQVSAEMHERLRAWFPDAKIHRYP